MDELRVHTVDISHPRLVELTKLADQAKPFYDWIEKKVKILTGSSKGLNDLLHELTEEEIKHALLACFMATDETKPFLFDGAGRTYPHLKACFYFFAWMIRDAPQQRLAPLIQRMRKAEGVGIIEAEVDVLAKLLYEYRDSVKSFAWPAVREVVIDRLEGSRRSIKGHDLEVLCRTALVTSFQNYFETHNNYGIYKSVNIAKSQIKLGNHTFDSSARLCLADGTERLLLVPVKTRETEGGGHAHLFSRDVVTAVTETRNILPNAVMCLVIVAKNWSPREIEGIHNLVNKVFYFDSNPNIFSGFDDASQTHLNLFIQDVLDGKH